LSFPTLAALRIEIPKTGEWVLIHRRTQNDLPAEVLGNRCWIQSRDDQESGYVIDNPRTTQQIPVEFINDRWYQLQQQRAGYCTRNQLRLARVNKLRLGSLPIVSDNLEPMTSPVQPGPSTEVITAGLHHIVTTQGTNPLIEEGPPSIMTSIEQNIAQGGEIPLSYPPVAAVNATDEAQSSTNEGGQGSLKGSPPKEFDGTRSKSETFGDDFSIYQRINGKNQVMKESYSRALMAMSFMKGPKVQNWIRAQMRALDDKVDP